MADTSDTRALTRYRVASIPAVLPAEVMTRSPPRRIAARRVIDSRRALELLKEMLPFLYFGQQVHVRVPSR